MGVKNIQGEVRINGEKVATQDWLEDTYVEPLKDELETNNAIMAQGGLHKQEDIVDTYNERITAKGENILDNSEAELKNVVGNTVKCENLIVQPFSTSTSNRGVNITYRDDGAVVLNGTTTGNEFAVSQALSLQAGKTYTLMLYANDYTSLHSVISLVTSTGSHITNLGTSDKDKKFTFTVTEDMLVDGQYLKVNIYAYKVDGITFNNRVVHLMLNEGETALPYQPYFTGLKNASFSGIESTGRNLFDITKIQAGNIGNFTIDGNNVLFDPLTSTIDGFAFSYWIDVKPNTDYQINYSAKSVDRVYIYTDKLFGNVVSILQLVNGKKFNSGNNTRLLIAWYSLYKNRDGAKETISNIMINIGATALPFEPYLSSTLNFPKEEELGKWDTISFANKTITRRTGYYVFKGNEYTAAHSSIAGRFDVQAFVNAASTAITTTVQSVCNLFDDITENELNGGTNGVATKKYNLLLRDPRFTTVDEVKAYLKSQYDSGNPVVIAYRLSTDVSTTEPVPFTDAQNASDNKYKVWINGTEKVIDNDGAECGANNTLTQNYTIINAIPKSGYADQDYVNNKFLPKVTTSTTYAQAYVKASGGSQSMVNVTAAPVANTIAKRDGTGQVLASAPTSSQSATPKSYVDEITDNLQKELTLINTALTQSGIVYTADVEDTYNERITADGLNVLDSSKAVLKKVVGSTVKCENLIPYPYYHTTKTIDGITFTDNGDGSITFSGKFASTTGNFRITDFLLAKDLTLPVGTYTISGNLSGVGTYTYRILVIATRTDGSINYYQDIQGQSLFEIYEGDSVNITIRVGDEFDGVARTYKPMLNAGSTALPYQPYFTGLKSASFAGIESKNANGTEVSTLNFPKTEVGKWDGIYVENQKIIRGTIIRGTKIHIFDGTENWVQQTVSGSDATMNEYGIYSFMLQKVPPSKSNAVGICNMFDNAPLSFASISVEGFMAHTAGEYYFRTKSYTTVEEWKAHLAELYASGNPLMLAYELATPTETPFTDTQIANGNTYPVYSHGTESIIENDNATHGAILTLSQNYIIVNEVN